MRRAGYCEGRSSSGSTSSTPRTRTGLTAAETLVADALHPYDGVVVATKAGLTPAGAGTLEQGRAPRVPPSSLPREPRASARRADRPLPATRGRSRGTDRGVGRSALRASVRREDPSRRRVQRRRRSSSRRALAVEPIVSVQNRFSLADRSSQRRARRLRAQRARVHRVGAAREGRARPRRTDARRDREDARRDAGQVALAWILAVVSRDAADSGNVLARPPRGERRAPPRPAPRRRSRRARAHGLLDAEAARGDDGAPGTPKAGRLVSEWRVETVRDIEEIGAVAKPGTRSARGRRRPIRTTSRSSSDFARRRSARTFVCLFEGDEPVALAVGRIEDVELPARIGYRKVLSPRLRVLTVVQGGILGDTSEPVARALLSELMAALARGEADVLRLRLLEVGSPLHQLARTMPSALCRQRSSQPSTRWLVEIPESFDAFLKARSKSMRNNIRYYAKRLLSEYGERARVEHFHDGSISSACTETRPRLPRRPTSRHSARPSRTRRSGARSTTSLSGVAGSGRTCCSSTNGRLRSGTRPPIAASYTLGSRATTRRTATSASERSSSAASSRTRAQTPTSRCSITASGTRTTSDGSRTGAGSRRTYSSSRDPGRACERTSRVPRYSGWVDWAGAPSVAARIRSAA